MPYGIFQVQQTGKYALGVRIEEHGGPTQPQDKAVGGGSLKRIHIWATWLAGVWWLQECMLTDYWEFGFILEECASCDGIAAPQR